MKTRPDDVPVVLSRAEAAALLSLVGLGMSTYFEDMDAARETRELLDRMPTEHLVGAMRKLEDALAEAAGEAA